MVVDFQGSDCALSHKENLSHTLDGRPPQKSPGNFWARPAGLSPSQIKEKET